MVLGRLGLDKSVCVCLCSSVMDPDDYGPVRQSVGRRVGPAEVACWGWGMTPLEVGKNI